MSDQSVREHVLNLLKGGGAHLGFEQAIAGLPEELRGAKVDSAPRTPWRLLGAYANLPMGHSCFPTSMIGSLERMMSCSVVEGDGLTARRG